LLRLGRTTVYLLDTDLEENAPWDRRLTARLYGGDRETRIQQEIVLGLGGVRLLNALGISPAVWHLNEGHAGFVILQRLRDAIEAGRTVAAALAEIRATTVFTTHTPVAAGHDSFPFELVRANLAQAWGALGADHEVFLGLGSYADGGPELFNMTALALRSSTRINGVSVLHGQVTRRMWGPIWPNVPEDERPVGSITNGIHLPTWVAPVLGSLLERRLGVDWREHQDEQAYWDRLLDVPDDELWQVRRMLRRYLFTFIRERARSRWSQDGVSAARMMAAGLMLDPEALTVGFARRFTAYKRPELIFRDEPRLIRLLTDPERPLQIVFAGKAHPADEAGKHHILRIVGRTQDPRFAGRIAFIGDYDVHVARHLVQGCDVWLNTPRKPLEASGTSGMKASVNGVPNLSIADGWWAEGYTGSNGWSIDGASNLDDPEGADVADSAALYDLLEREVVPRYYDRDESDVPHAWVTLVKEAIRTVAPRFSARRMLKEYATHAYADVPFGRDGEAQQSRGVEVAGTAD
jgi:starch phosphorylase